MKAKFFAKMLTILVIIFSNVFGATTGKIMGTVRDKNTGDPLVGVNVVIEDLSVGAATDMNGHYSIINVPSGTYTLRFSMMGYRTVKVNEVEVNVDLTTNIDVKLTTVDIQGEAIEIIAERKAVKKDMTATTSIVDSEKIDLMPVTDMNDIVEMQAGMVDGHMRGGRSGEVQYRIDGMSVSDVYDGEQLITVSKNMVKELQVVSGAFNAEYGQAMSGIVNVTTKSMYDDWGGNIEMYAGDYVTSHTDIFMGTNKINPLATQNLNFTLHGPIFKNRLSIALNTRQLHWEGPLHGKNKYKPWTTGIATGQEFIPLGSNPTIDSLVVESASEISPNNSPQEFDSAYTVYQNAHKDPAGNGDIVSMDWNENRYYHGVIGFKPTNKLKFTLQGIYRDFVYQEYDRMYKYNPEGILTNYEDSYNFSLQMNHSLSSKLFYNLSISEARKKHEEKNDDDYIVYSKLLNTLNSYSFHTGGTNNWRESRETVSRSVDFNITSQINRANKLKAGVKAQFHELTYEGYTLQPPQDKKEINEIWERPVIDPADAVIEGDSSINYDDYVHNPTQVSAYIQDKIELQELIINVGARFDYFEPDGKVLADPTDPDIYNPVRQEHMDDSLSQRREYWYKEASDKYQISPRFGASFPITESGVVHISYGHFFQMPRFQYLYRNPEFQLNPGTGNQGLIGNANMKAEKTIKGEIGIKQEVMEGLVFDATAYFRDIRDLTGTRNAIVETFRGGKRYDRIQNSDFAYVKGLVLSLDYDNGKGVYGSLDYTFQVAKGSASDPEEARNARTSGQMPEVHIMPLNWDQRHTVKINAGYNTESFGVNIIGNYGTGMPYTPTSSREISTILTNSERQPSTLNMDCNLSYFTQLMGARQKWYLRISNLFDRLNASGVYPRSGDPDFTPEEERVKSTNPDQSVNSVEEWYTNATHYQYPRRIEFGVSINF